MKAGQTYRRIQIVGRIGVWGTDRYHRCEISQPNRLDPRHRCSMSFLKDRNYRASETTPRIIATIPASDAAACEPLGHGRKGVMRSPQRFCRFDSPLYRQKRVQGASPHAQKWISHAQRVTTRAQEPISHAQRGITHVQEAITHAQRAISHAQNASPHAQRPITRMQRAIICVQRVPTRVRQSFRPLGDGSLLVSLPS
jgi:hypothetical protein